MAIDLGRLAQQFLDDLYEKIKHGDAQHQLWLKEELDKWHERLLNDLCTACQSGYASKEP